MSDDNDYSWGKERATNTDKLGHIVAIPLEEADPSVIEQETKVRNEENADIAVDEFKEKMSKILSQKLHQD